MNLTSLTGSGVKTVQRGLAAVTGGTPLGVTVTAVVTAKSELRLLGQSAVAAAYIQLTNTTTVTVTSASTQSVSWELTEFF